MIWLVAAVFAFSLVALLLVGLFSTETVEPGHPEFDDPWRDERLP